jgi:hypothetical protein
MPPRLSGAADDLLARATQDSGRLNFLAKYCVDSFGQAGLPGVRGGKAAEIGILGLGRQKDWDLAYVHAGKPPPAGFTQVDTEEPAGRRAQQT